MHIVLLGLGSNIGDRLFYINSAIEKITEIRSNILTTASAIYETEPWGVSEQELYLNCVIKIETELSPEELFVQIKLIETDLGRESTEKWSARKIDIDILFFDDIIFDDGKISIPHSKIQERNFVLIPLNEIDQNYIHPVFNKTIKELLEDSSDKLQVYKF
ncbi:2-amino-4-hydroxy-6-hydroxymethyldihydropteridinediphosphokinase [soil metagenome]